MPGRDAASLPGRPNAAEQHKGSLRWFTRFGVYTATPWAFLIVMVYAVAWATLGRLDFSGIATLIVWTMTLFIQRAQHRDTQAIHAKLDELLRVEGDARSELTNLDEDEPEEIEEFRKHEQVAEGNATVAKGAL